MPNDVPDRNRTVLFRPASSRGFERLNTEPRGGRRPAHRHQPVDRYDELRALATADPERLEPLLRPQGRVILAIDGLQPDVGHEVLWVLRDCLSGEILLAKSLLSSTAKDLA